MSILARIFVFFAMLTIGAATSISQAPTPAAVPTVRPEATSTLTGSLTDSTGAVVNHATVTATDQDTGASVTSYVSASGKFSLHVPAGSYQLNIKADGFASTTREVNVAPDSTATLNVILGGPVPIVQRHPPAPDEHATSGTPGSSHRSEIAASDVTVQSCSGATKSDLLDCISTSADGHRLLGVIGGDTGSAYFIWLRDPSARASDIHISEPIALPSTAAVRTAFPKNATDFCGSVKTSTGYLLFYR